MPLDIIEIIHVNVTVPRELEEATKHFYSYVLGLNEVPKPENSRGRGGAWFQLGALQLHLSIEDEAAAHHPSKRHVCYLVRDLADAERQLREAGAEIFPDQHPVPGWRRFFAADPGGNRIEIAQRVAEA
jgi:catechol 2,3-dioxygenase-like lactoylglutathione lyase family enzyme